MVSVTRRGAMLIVAAAACAAPLLGAVPALAAPPPGALVAGPTDPPDQGQQQPEPVDLVFVEVTPSTVQAGFLVGIRASCRDNSVPAIVVSDAFGRVQVQPQRGLLTASPMVRERTRPGNYRVKLECPSGQTASTMLQVVKATPSRTAAPPSRGPATGFGGTAGIGLGGLLVPVGLALTVAGAVVGVAAARRPRMARR
ncbi:hypothetical protein [Micromonospora sp. CB01531]|uniref:hypothetical protein n=1 Tax=Micromonospora sp. CB01531 TaxID=1718947 RepID=UPI00093E6E63|nr:hypothetical protein [Micromonospora sp. CB01531]OKI45169.1 hypothetical protein A6A27_12240 [Micromonospora sp. CB01531]